MATNFYEKYMKPVGRGRRGGGGELLGAAGRALQQRGTPGGMLLGMALQAMGGMGRGGGLNEDPEVEAARKDAILRGNRIGSQFDDKNAANTSAHLQNTTESSGIDLGNKRLEQTYIPGRLETQKKLGDINVESTALSLADQKRVSDKQQQDLKRAEFGLKAAAQDAVEAKMKPDAALKYFGDRGESVITDRGVLEFAPDAAQWDPALIDPEVRAMVASHLPRAVAQKEAEAAKTYAATKAEQEEVMKDVNLAMKADLDNFHGIARSNGIKISLGTGDDELADIGGVRSKLSGLPEEDRAQAMFYLKRRNDMLSSILNAKASGGLSRKTIAPFFTDKYVAEAFNKSNTAPAPGVDSLPEVKVVPLAEIQQRQPGAGANLGQQLFPGGVPQGGQASVSQSPSVSQALGALSQAQLQIASALKQLGYNKDQVGAELLRLSNANTR